MSELDNRIENHLDLLPIHFKGAKPTTPVARAIMLKSDGGQEEGYEMEVRIRGYNIIRDFAETQTLGEHALRALYWVIGNGNGGRPTEERFWPESAKVNFKGLDDWESIVAGIMGLVETQRLPGNIGMAELLNELSTVMGHVSHKIASQNGYPTEPIDPSAVVKAVVPTLEKVVEGEDEYHIMDLSKGVCLVEGGAGELAVKHLKEASDFLSLASGANVKHALTRPLKDLENGDYIYAVSTFGGWEFRVARVPEVKMMKVHSPDAAMVRQYVVKGSEYFLTTVFITARDYQVHFSRARPKLRMEGEGPCPVTILSNGVSLPRLKFNLKQAIRIIDALKTSELKVPTRAFLALSTRFLTQPDYVRTVGMNTFQLNLSFWVGDMATKFGLTVPNILDIEAIASVCVDANLKANSLRRQVADFACSAMDMQGKNAAVFKYLDERRSWAIDKYGNVWGYTASTRKVPVGMTNSGKVNRNFAQFLHTFVDPTWFSDAGGVIDAEVSKATDNVVDLASVTEASIAENAKKEKPTPYVVEQFTPTIKFKDTEEVQLTMGSRADLAKIMSNEQEAYGKKVPLSEPSLGFYNFGRVMVWLNLLQRPEKMPNIMNAQGDTQVPGWIQYLKFNRLASVIALKNQSFGDVPGKLMPYLIAGIAAAALNGRILIPRFIDRKNSSDPEVRAGTKGRTPGGPGKKANDRVLESRYTRLAPDFLEEASKTDDVTAKVRIAIRGVWDAVQNINKLSQEADKAEAVTNPEFQTFQFVEEEVGRHDTNEIRTAMSAMISLGGDSLVQALVRKAGERIAVAAPGEVT